MKHALSIIVVLLTLGTGASGADVDSYRDTYQQKLNEIIWESGTSEVQAVRLYQQGVEELLARVKKDGDLDRAKAVMAELDRFATNHMMSRAIPGVPEHLPVQAAYARRMKAVEWSRASRIITLTSQYDAALERLEKTLVAGDQLPDAQAVRSERTRAMQSPLLQEAKAAALAHEETNRVTAARSEKPQPVVSGKASEAPTVSRGLVLHYTFDDVSASEVPDHSELRNPGAVQGTKRIPDGKRKDAVSFDGKGACIEVSPFGSISKGSDFTLCVWLRLPRLQYYLAIVATEPFAVMAQKGHLSWAWFRPDGTQAALMRTPSLPLTTNQWQHVSFVRRGDSLEYYVDGRLIFERPTDLPDTAMKSLRIGQPVVPDSGSPLVGDLDELMIFNRALTKAEIARVRKAVDEGARPGGD